MGVPRLAARVGSSPSPRRILVGLLVALLAAGATLPAVTAAGTQPNKKVLKKARKKYKAAQHKCIAGHDLSQLPRILKYAKQIHKNGGKAIPKKELYRCVRFSVKFSSTLTVKGNSTANNRTDSVNFTYKVLDGADGIAYTLEPDFKDASPGGAWAQGGSTAGPIDYRFSGQGSDHLNGASCTQTQTANGVTDGRGFGAMVSLDPSAADPRKTIELSLTVTPPTEKYSVSYCDTHDSRQGEAWKTSYYFLRRNQLPAVTRDLTCVGYVFKRVATQPDGQQQIGSQARTISKPSDGPPTTPNSAACGAFPAGPMWQIPLHLTETTTYAVYHDPCPEKKAAGRRLGSAKIKRPCS